MSITNGQGMEALTVRRAVIADADKVRYRVYRSADDFIAVIAESALMAVKVSGISEPFRIVRDLPSENVSLEAQRMATIGVPEQVRFAVSQREKNTDPVEFAPVVSAADGFVPMRLRDFSNPRGKKIRILTHEAMQQLQPTSAPFVEPMAKPSEPVVMAPEPEPMREEPVVPVMEAAAPVPEPEPEDTGVLSPEEVEKLLGN